MRQSAPALHPAEDLCHPLALSLTDPIAVMPRRASIEAGGVAALDLGDVRADVPAAQKLDKGLAVIAFVASQAPRLAPLASLTLEQLGRRGGSRSA